MQNDFYNAEGYPDPTPAKAIERLERRKGKAKFLIKIIRFIIWESGFALCGKIELEDRFTGEKFK